MKKYLSTLHTRPDHHKRRFALAVSACFTLAIFAIWYGVNYGQGGLMAQQASIEENRAHPDISPLESVGSQLGSSIEAIKGSFNDLKGASNSLKSKALDSYGQ